MLNKPPTSSMSSVIGSYRKRRQQRGPFLIYGAAALLILIGIILLIIWLTGPSQPLNALFATETPTPTLTFTPTITSSPTDTPTITPTETVTATSTPSAPFLYTVQEGESLATIAEKFGLAEDGILLMLDLNPAVDQNNGIIFVGQQIYIPNPGLQRPTSTPIPPELPRGTRIEYKVLPGDTLAGIAARFNSITEEIIRVNNIENANALQVGQRLQIPVNLVTPTATRPPTSTPVSPTAPAGQSTNTPQPGAPTATSATGGGTACAYTENAAFVTELQRLINNARTQNSLSALALNSKLSAAAKVLAVDMACNNFMSHTGSDGSSPSTRVAAQGYTASLVLEDIYAQPPQFGGNAQTAFDWWMNDAAHRADLLNSNATEFGIAYVFYDKSQLGGYFVVVSAKP